MVCDMFDVVPVYNGTLTFIHSIALDFTFDVSGVLPRVLAEFSLEIDSHKIVLMRSSFEHLNPLRLTVPFYLNICTVMNLLIFIRFTSIP